MQLIAKTMAGLEPVLQKELKALGAEDTQILRRAVSFKGNLELIYGANYQCRTALRILSPVFHGQAGSYEDLQKQLLKLPWEKYLDVDQSFLIEFFTSGKVFKHSYYAAQLMKDAIVDRFREQSGRRPSVDKENPQIIFHLHIIETRWQVLLDSSGKSLHKRGYRKEADKAPLNEVLAAGMIQLTEWDGITDFMDPMCGSGTLPIEAAMAAQDIPAGYFRDSYAFFNWPDFDEKLWQKVKENADGKVKEAPGRIIGADRSLKAISIARRNVNYARLKYDVELFHRDIKDFNPEVTKGLLLFNPPYGERLDLNESQKFYKFIGDTLKNNFKGFTAWLFTADLEGLKHLGLRTSKRITLYNGPLEGRLIRYDLY